MHHLHWLAEFTEWYDMIYDKTNNHSFSVIFNRWNIGNYGSTSNNHQIFLCRVMNNISNYIISFFLHFLVFFCCAKNVQPISKSCDCNVIENHPSKKKMNKYSIHWNVIRSLTVFAEANVEVDLRMLRSFRVLRPLKLVSRIPSKRRACHIFHHPKLPLMDSYKSNIDHLNSVWFGGREKERERDLFVKIKFVLCQYCGQKKHQSKILRALSDTEIWGVCL